MPQLTSSSASCSSFTGTNYCQTCTVHLLSPVHVSMTGLLVHASAPFLPDTDSAAYDADGDLAYFSHFDSAYHVQASNDGKIHAKADGLSKLDAYALALSPA